MNVTIDHKASDKMYVDTTNGITAKDKEIITLNIDTNKNSSSNNIARVIGCILGLTNKELEAFIIINNYVDKERRYIFTKAYVLDIIKINLATSTRTADRYINTLISHRAVLYDITNDTIRINPRYRSSADIKKIKVMVIMFD